MNLLVDLKNLDATPPTAGVADGKSPFDKLKQLLMPFVGRDDLIRALGYTTNAGSPIGSLVPQFTGQVCLDTTNNIFYRAIGNSANTQWAVQSENFADSITAFATGGQTNATQLTAQNNRISVCATAGDSVKLPAATPGLEVEVVNSGAAAADVFPKLGDAINNLGANVAMRIGTNTQVFFVCHTAGTWMAQVPRAAAKFVTRALSSSTANAGDLTGAAFVTLTNTGATPGTLTTRTGAQMIADGAYQNGDSFMLRIINGQGTGVLTLAAGDGNVTLTGTMTMATNSFRDFVVTVTGAATLTIQNAGTGTFS